MSAITNLSKTALNLFNFSLISNAITTFQKVAFVAYMSAQLYTGSALPFLLGLVTPSDDRSWLGGWFGRGDSEGCEAASDLLASPHCVRKVFVVGASEVLNAAAPLPPRQRLHYLLVVGACRALAPYLFAPSVAAAALAAAFLVRAAAGYTQRLLHTVGINTPPLDDSFFEILDTIMNYIVTTGQHYLKIFIGFLVVSIVTCPLTLGFEGFLQNPVCRSSFGLYCIRGLSAAVFKDPGPLPLDWKERWLLRVAHAATSITLTCALYYATIFFLAAVIYILVDTAKSIGAESATAVGSVWRRCFPDLADIRRAVAAKRRLTILRDTFQ